MAEGIGYAAAVVLAAVFLWAAAAKLARPEETRAGFQALGVPMASLLSQTVPVLELVLAAVLVAFPAVGGVIAFVLLALFTVVLARAVRAGVSTGCTCFGAVLVEPVSGSDLLRNGLLAAAAVGAWGTPEPAAPSPAAVVLLALFLLAGTALIRFSRRRSQARGPG